MEAQRISWSDIRTYFQQLAEDSSKDSSIVILSLCNAAWCLAEMEDYDGAYAELDSLLDKTDKSYEQITIALQRLFVELKENSYALLCARPDGSGGSPRMAGTLDEASQTFEAKLERISRRVDSLLAAYHHGTTPPPRATTFVPKVFALYQNYPNPFNPNTEIRFDLPEATTVNLKLYDLLGREVAVLTTGRFEAGSHKVPFNARNLASGVYVYSLKAGSLSAQRKLIVMK